MEPTRTREEAVRYLVAEHFETEPDLKCVFWIQSDDEPLRLIEVTAATLWTGSVVPFLFGGTADVPFYVAIAEITENELAQINRGAIKLPAGWDWARAERFDRPHAAA